MTTVADALGMAVRQIQEGRLDLAGRIVSRVQATYPEQGEVVRILTSIAYMAGLRRRALHLVTLARALAPAQGALLDDLAVIAQSGGDRALCFRAAGRALAVLGPSPERLRLRANMAIERAEIGHARRIGMLAVALSPDDGAAFFHWSHQMNFATSLDPVRLATARLVGGRRFFGACPRPAPKSLVRPREKRPLRVGIVGGTMLGATTHGASLLPLHRALDRTRIEIVYYSDREVGAEQPESRALADLSAGWRRTHGIDDAAMADLMREDGLDIAVDLVGHLVGERSAVFAHRPAPVQVSYLHIAPSGHPGIDYAIVDPFLVPEGCEDWMTEACVRVPCVHLFESPFPLPPADPPPAETLGRPVTFGSFNVLGKVNPESLSLWAAVLKAIPGSRLILKNQGFSDPSVVARFAGLLTREGVAPERLDFRAHTASFEDHIAMLNEIDIALDPSPYVGIITTCEAYLMGVPVVSMPGRSVVSGYARSIAHQVGLDDLIAADPGGFVAIAKGLSADADRRRELRQALPDRFRRSLLGDASAFAETMTLAFEAMVRRWTEGRPPGHLTVTETGEVIER
ncbi:MAG: hypothetical protein NXI16_05100 [Alphaproteobacteria bacterium]|nr:hypothetical protein [Alphaproteobacteria bacterium]